MKVGDHYESSRTGSPVLSAFWGAIVALVLAYGLSYFLTRLGVANITSPGSTPDHGPATLARAGMNLCAVQHTVLSASGTMRDALGSSIKVQAGILLPLTLWAIIPVIALIVGGYAAGKIRAGNSRWLAILPAVIGGILYAGILALVSGLFKCHIDPTSLPSVKAWEFNPPDVAFKPAAMSVFSSAALFGAVFSAIGAHIAVRGTSATRYPSKWWACGKSVVVVVLVVQLLMAGAVEVWLMSDVRSDRIAGSVETHLVKMMPTITGVAYSVMNGSTLSAGIESKMGSAGVNKPFTANANLYTGVKKTDRGTTTHTTIPHAWVGALIVCLGALISGALAVRWGSRDGSVPTGARIAFIHTVYLTALIYLCSISLRVSESLASTHISVSMDVGWLLAASFLGVFISAFIGAFIMHRLYVIRRGGFPAL